MTREQLEHAIRAAAEVSGESELIVIGSQAVLGRYPNAPEALRLSQEVDIFAPAAPHMSDMIDGALGQQSHFERTFGFYVDGVSPTTARVAPDWREWLIPVCNANTSGATGWCLEPHDIAVAKYFAGREKDLRYTANLWEASYIDPELLHARLRDTRMEPAKRE